MAAKVRCAANAAVRAPLGVTEHVAPMELQRRLQKHNYRHCAPSGVFPIQRSEAKSSCRNIAGAPSARHVYSLARYLAP